MDEIIRIFTAGLIRHMMNTHGLSSSVKREETSNIDLIVRRNERDIGLRNVTDNSQLTRKRI